MEEPAIDPETNPDSPGMTELFEVADLQRLQDLFSDATGVASIITWPDGRPITRPSNFCRLCSDVIRNTEKGMQNCMKSDSVLGRYEPDGPVVHPCLSGGLWDAGASITVGGRHVANWLIGQVRIPGQTDEEFLRYASEIGAEPEEFMNALSEVPVMPLDQFKKIARMLHAFAGELSQNLYRNRMLEKQIDARIKAEEQGTMLSLALKSISECVCISDMDDRILFVNEAFTKTYGYSEEELVGSQVSMVRAEGNDPVALREIFSHTLTGGWRGELLNRRKDGTIFPVLISTSVIRDESDRPVAVMGVASDITEFKHFEAALRESEEKYRALFNGARDAIFIMNNTCFLDCNDSTAKIFGTRVDQIIGTSPADHSPEYQPDGIPSLRKAQMYIDAALAGEPQLFEWVHLRADGSSFYTEVGLNRIRLKGNWYLQAIVRDMSKRKQAEDALRDKAFELERFNRLMVGRELKMIELKREINELRKTLGLIPKYRTID